MTLLLLLLLHLHAPLSPCLLHLMCVCSSDDDKTIRGTELLPPPSCHCRKLSWEAATDRLLEVGSISKDEWPSAAEQRYTATLWRMYRSIVGE